LLASPPSQPAVDAAEDGHGHVGHRGLAAGGGAFPVDQDGIHDLVVALTLPQQDVPLPGLAVRDGPREGRAQLALVQEVHELGPDFVQAPVQVVAAGNSAQEPREVPVKRFNYYS